MRGHFHCPPSEKQVTGDHFHPPARRVKVTRGHIKAKRDPTAHTAAGQIAGAATAVRRALPPSSAGSATTFAGAVLRATCAAGSVVVITS